MDRIGEPVGEITQRLRCAREPLVRKVVRCKMDLEFMCSNRKFLISLLLGALTLLLGLFLLWLIVTGSVPFTYTIFGREFFWIPPLPWMVGIFGIALTLVGIVFIPWAVRVRIYYPSRLHDLIEILKELDGFLKSPQYSRKDEHAIRIIRKLERHLGRTWW